MKLLVLAAGNSSRFGGLKQYTPIDSDGNFILDFTLKDAIKSGIKEVVFVIRKEHEEVFLNTLYKRYSNLLKINYVYQLIPKNRFKPLGTADAVIAAKAYLNDNFLVINSDDYYGLKALELAKNFFNNQGDNSIANITYYLKNTLNSTGLESRAICNISNNEIVSMKEVKAYKENDKIYAHQDGKDAVLMSGDEQISMNLFCLNPHFISLLEEKFKQKTFKADEEFIIPEIVNELLEEKRIKVIPILDSETSFGITVKEDLKLIKKLAR